MNKAKKFLVGLLAFASVSAFALGVSACGDDNTGDNTTPAEKTEIEQVYDTYVEYATAQGQTPLDYQTWLATIQGAKGDKGDKGETGVSIESVEFDENGNLLITFTDKSTQTVEMPQSNEPIHAYGEWICFTADDVPCEERLFYQVCEDCNRVEWKKGSYDDHDWEDEYRFDNSFHWIKCENCTKTKDNAEHDIDESGYCTVCDRPVMLMHTLASGEYGFDESGAFIDDDNADGCELVATEYANEEDDGLYTYIIQIDATFESAGRYFFVSDYEQTFGDASALTDSSLYETKNVYTCLTTTANETDTFYIYVESMFTSETYEYEMIYLPTQTAAVGDNTDKEMHSVADWEFTFTAPKAGQYAITPAANSATLKLGVAGEGTYVDYISHTNANGALIVTATEDNQTVSFFARSNQEKASFTIAEYVPERFPASYTFSRAGEESATLDIAVKAGGSTNIIIQDKALCQISWTDANLTYRFNGLEVTDTALLFAGKYQGTHTLTVINNSATDSEQTLTLTQVTNIPTGTSSIYLPSSSDNRQFTLGVSVETAMQLTVDESVAAIYKSEDATALSELVLQPADGIVNVQIAAKSADSVISQITFDILRNE